ncbi:MAG: hypothetical protein JJ953_01430 [Gracilimonas sp.]|uniref:hypothetical protein n=1 Tax=Gracilimonas sp. TaxID=1974203 RepID=UPI001B129558|nr:hypothetical protein [Gracilimonas sp.]MBO6584744.1 hypothetical protein [Gracilimonas sp.]MBO6615985.1 hypothetical protein [Gracilimonas sp.]
MSSIKAEIQYPKNLNTYSIEALNGKVDIIKLCDHVLEGEERYVFEVDGVEQHNHKGKKLKIEISRALVDQIVEQILELQKVSPESHFTTSEGETYYFHKPKTKSIEF